MRISCHRWQCIATGQQISQLDFLYWPVGTDTTSQNANRLALPYIVARVAVNAQHDFHLTLYLDRYSKEMHPQDIGLERETIYQLMKKKTSRKRGKKGIIIINVPHGQLTRKEEVNRPSNCKGRKYSMYHTLFLFSLFFSE